MNNYGGQWVTSFGPMTLAQKRKQVTGTYQMGNDECTLEGDVNKQRLTFRFAEPDASGEGWFEMVRPGKFAGQWRPDGTESWSTWIGERGFEGTWETSFGPMRLFQEKNRVHGCYEGVGHSTINGEFKNGRLEFTYTEPNARGEGWFELADDQMSFAGQWQAEDSDMWQPWKGMRRQAQPDLTWLVVLEAHWQTHLRENEYAFGNMLREFFARVPNVKVRQRYFTNSDGLEKWCRELMYLPEPVALVVASHGTQEGLTAHGELISPSVLGKGLHYVDNLKLVHLSSCLTMEQEEAGAMYKELKGTCPFSGYTTSVDWAASAMTEFLYLDMVLSKGLSPEDAAEQVVRLLAFSGDNVLPDSPYPAAGFRFYSVGDDVKKAEPALMWA